MATGSLTDYPWLFRKFLRPLGLQALQAFGPPSPAGYHQRRLSEGDPASPTPPYGDYGVTDSKKPAEKDADS